MMLQGSAVCGVGVLHIRAGPGLKDVCSAQQEGVGFLGACASASPQKGSSAMMSVAGADLCGEESGC